MIFQLYIKAPHETFWRKFTSGDHSEINYWIDYITKKYPHTSYKTEVLQ